MQGEAEHVGYQRYDAVAGGATARDRGVGRGGFPLGALAAL